MAAGLIMTASWVGNYATSATYSDPDDNDVENIQNLQTDDLVIPSSGGGKTSTTSVKVPSGRPGTAGGGAVTTSSSKPFRVKQRRSRSAQRWVEHRDADMVKTGTVFKPSLKHKKVVTAAPTLKDMHNQSNYVLQHQEVDTEGEVETRLYKGDIIPTRSGGSQVEFNDVETLVCRSPNKARSSNVVTEIDTENMDANIPQSNQHNLIPGSSKLNTSCVRDSPTIEQRKAELKSNGLFGGFNTAITGHPTGVTSIQSSLADPIAIKKSKISNKKETVL